MHQSDIRVVSTLSELQEFEAQELSGGWKLEHNKTTYPKRRPGFARKFYYYRNASGAYHPSWPSEKVDVPLEIAEIA